ncbi:MAG: DNA mismatch repair endonuclease MutL [Myxococcota bacterium]
MSEIRVLADDLVNQIAAGEVVERPASVVKELVENALDAEATRIQVAIAEGGMRWISVGDDGIGMTRQAAELAFRRHATSKIRSAEDLARVGTLGFRGEALPSIAGVARVRMRTRSASTDVGVELVGEGTGIERVRDVACPLGTLVEVSDLFGRIPARRKFLKTPVTEGSHIVRWLERIVLTRPDVRFELERDGRRTLFLPPTADPRERALAVLPHSIAGRLLEVEGRTPSARVFGFATPTDVLRGTTSDIHVFVNARPVRDRLLLQAVRAAYRDALPPGRHPVVVLFLDVDPGDVDVNVHPAKWEVRFRDPRAISDLVRRSLASALGPRQHVDPGTTAAYLQQTAARTPRVGEGPAPGDFALAPPLWSPTAPPAGAAPFSFAALRYLGQALGTFLVLEAPNQLVLLDQHAAHERVLFERMRQTLLDGKLERQRLLTPIWLELPRSAADALFQNLERLDRAGFEVEVGDSSLRGGVRVGIRAVPAALAAGPRTDWPTLLEETATGLRDPEARGSRDGLEGALHGILATAACHAAARKGDRFEPPEVRALLEALDETVWFPNCPHGRPILSALDEAELGRRFLRR